MVNTRMEGRIDVLERFVEEIQRERAADSERLNQLENTLRNVTNKRLARIDVAMNGILDQLRRRRQNDEETIHNHGGGGGHHDEGGGEGGGHVENGKHRKLEMPVFEGEDPLGWIFRVERYFLVNGVPEVEKLDAAMVSLEGKALSWF